MAQKLLDYLIRNCYWLVIISLLLFAVIFSSGCHAVKDNPDYAIEIPAKLN
jgi:hypothetical protein